MANFTFQGVTPTNNAAASNNLLVASQDRLQQALAGAGKIVTDAQAGIIKNNTDALLSDIQSKLTPEQALDPAYQQQVIAHIGQFAPDQVDRAGVLNALRQQATDVVATQKQRADQALLPLTAQFNQYRAAGDQKGMQATLAQMGAIKGADITAQTGATVQDRNTGIEQGFAATNASANLTQALTGKYNANTQRMNTNSEIESRKIQNLITSGKAQNEAKPGTVYDNPDGTVTTLEAPGNRTLRKASAIAEGNIGGLIGSGEGGYNSYNKGSAGDSAAAPKLDLTNMTIGDIQGLQAGKKLFAAGQYQIIPDTLAGAVKALKLPADTKFTPEVQDQINQNYLMRQGSGKGFYDFVTGHSNDADAATLGMSKVYASIGVPSSVKNDKGVPIAAGESFYKDRGGNKSSITPDDFKKTMIAQRNIYTSLVQKGIPPEQAWSQSFKGNGKTTLPLDAALLTAGATKPQTVSSLAELNTGATPALTRQQSAEVKNNTATSLNTLKATQAVQQLKDNDSASTTARDWLQGNAVTGSKGVSGYLGLGDKLAGELVKTLPDLYVKNDKGQVIVDATGKPTLLTDGLSASALRNALDKTFNTVSNNTDPRASKDSRYSFKAPDGWKRWGAGSDTGNLLRENLIAAHKAPNIINTIGITSEIEKQITDTMAKTGASRAAVIRAMGVDSAGYPLKN